MTAPSRVTYRSTVLLRADATPDVGVGHAMRLLALAQELRSRDVDVHLAGHLEIPWVATAYEAAGVMLHPTPQGPADLVTLTDELDARAIVLDGYDLPPALGRALRAHGVPVVAFVDDTFGASQDADLYVDQNPGTTPRPVTPGQQALAGAPFTLFRDDVLAARRAPTPGAAGLGTGHEPIDVLAVFGGTDPLGAAPVVVPLILATGLPVHLTVVSGDDTWAEALRRELAPDQRLDVVGPVTDLARRAAASDLVVTASGSTVWELLCVGAPLAVVCVIDNQTPGYEMVLRDDLAAGLGHLEALRHDTDARTRAVVALREALVDPDARAARVHRGQALLDGAGRARVADAVLSLGQRETSAP